MDVTCGDVQKLFNIKAGYSRPIAGVVKTIKNVSFCCAASKKEQMFDFSVLLKMFVVYYKRMSELFLWVLFLFCPYGTIKMCQGAKTADLGQWVSGRQSIPDVAGVIQASARPSSDGWSL